MELNVSLPEGLALVSGNLSWKGNVPKDDSEDVIKAIVKSVKVGNWAIEVRGIMDPEKNNGFGGHTWYPLYVSISEKSAEWRVNPPYGAPDWTSILSPAETVPPPPVTVTSTPGKK